MSGIKYLILFPLLASFIYAQQSIVKNYTTLDGLPVSKIYDCTQDSEGNMWFAAQGGLIKYSGSEWTYYDSLLTDPLFDSFRFIINDENGNLWIFANNIHFEPMYLKNNAWESFKNFHVDDINNLVAADISILNQDTIIATANKNSDLFIYHNGEQLSLSSFRGKPFQIFDLDIIEQNVVVGSVYLSYHYYRFY